MKFHGYEVQMEAIIVLLMIFAVMLKFWPVWYLNPDLGNAAAVLYQMSYQANWELVFVCLG